MDPVEQIAVEESTRTTSDSVETLTAEEEASAQKTEQIVESLENKVDELYTTLEKNTTNGWKSLSGFLTNFQKNIPEYVNQTKEKMEKLSVNEQASEDEQGLLNDKLIENATSAVKKLELNKYLGLIKNSTNTYLDELDDDLQEVEKFVGGVASRFGSFLKDAIVAENRGEEDGDEELDENDVLFNVPTPPKVFSSRAEQKLYQLSHSKELYLNAIEDQTKYDEFVKTLKLEDPEPNLEKDTALKKLFTELVPAQISEQDFWSRFHYFKSLIESEESTRRKLLSEKVDDEDKFDWDDDDEEESQQAPDLKPVPTDTQLTSESRTSSEVTYNLESANSSTLDVVASKKTGNEEENEEDDDWE